MVTAGGAGGGPPTASRFAKGKSGNPGGRPKALPRFRARCRKVSFALLDEISARLAHQDPERPIPLPELVEALAAVAPFGGLLPVDRQAVDELARLRVAVWLLERGKLTAEERRALLAKVRPEPPAPAPTPDKGSDGQ